MKACLTCMSGLTAKDDDGTGRHVVCPPLGDRAAYLERRRRQRPGLLELHDRLRAGETFEETLHSTREVDNDTGT